jgi:hypothetical protein
MSRQLTMIVGYLAVLPQQTREPVMGREVRHQRLGIMP